jgi:hypothetical protein
VKYVFFSGNRVKLEMKKKLGYWWANFYNLSFNGVQIKIWTCINNILKYTYKGFAEKGILVVKYVFFSENHVKLEMKMNSVIGGQFFIRFNGKEYLRNYSCKP